MNSPNPYSPSKTQQAAPKYSRRFYFWCGFTAAFLAMFSLHFVRLWLTLSDSSAGGHEQLGFPLTFMERQWPPLQERFYKRAFLLDIGFDVGIAIVVGKIARKLVVSQHN